MEKKVASLKDEIALMRDEIKLQANLGKADVKDELEKLEKSWKAFLSKYKPFSNEIEKTAENTGAALHTAAEELKAGYENLRKLLK